MLKGKAKVDYQRDYMREYRRKKHVVRPSELDPSPEIPTTGGVSANLPEIDADGNVMPEL